MTQTKAIAAFRALTAVTRKVEGLTEDWPIFAVRLDAVADEEEHRAYRLRVTKLSRSGLVPENDDWRYALDVADEQEVEVIIENDGVVLR